MAAEIRCADAIFADYVCLLADAWRDWRGLPQYIDTLFRDGFDDMETLLEIQETPALLHFLRDVRWNCSGSVHQDEHLQAMGFLPGHMLKIKKRLGLGPLGPLDVPLSGETGVVISQVFGQKKARRCWGLFEAPSLDWARPAAFVSRFASLL